jgi:hypothetical protein
MPPPPGEGKRSRSRDAAFAPSPRVRGEGWDEGALPPGSDSGHAPSPARFARDLSPHSGERKIDLRSRDAPLHPSYDTARSRKREDGVRSATGGGACLVLRYGRFAKCSPDEVKRNSGEISLPGFAELVIGPATSGGTRWLHPGYEEKEKFGSETPTDAIGILPCRERARPRPHTGSAHLSAFHHGSRPKESFIARDSASGHASWDVAGTRFAYPFERHYPPLPIPVQRMHLAPRS